MARRSRWTQEEAEAEEDRDPCSRGEYCAGRTAETVDGRTVCWPAMTYQAFCPKDRAIISDCLGALPDEWLRLEKALGDHVVTEVMVRMPFGPSEPLSLSVDGLMRTLARSLCAWEARTRATARLTPPDLSLMPGSVEAIAAAADTLRRQLDVLLALQAAWMTRIIPLAPGRHGLPAVITDDVELERGDEEIVRMGVDFLTVITTRGTDGAAAGAEIMHLEYAARSVLMETPPRIEKLLGIPCRARDCDRRALRRADPPQHDGDPEYWSACMECRDVMTAGEFREWVKLNAAYHRAMSERPALAS